jgi:mannose-6-phosphate isomerase-like protein (cupin superfamily)
MAEREYVSKPWGYEVIWAKTDAYVGKQITIAAGHRLSNQYHQFKEENIFVISGHMTLKLQGAFDVRLKPGESYHIKPGVIHRFCADQGEDVHLIEVSTPHLDDVVRMEDDYDRC